ncbi:MAG: transcription termination factor NusA [Candidatus Omnitrophica bacterium]|nr:transcription termination factor NusA [Candidatus Omnitrophota bacterium]
MDAKELINALDYLEREKGIDRDTLIRSIEKGLLSVFRKRTNLENGISLRLDPKTGEIAFFDQEGKRMPISAFPLDRISAQSAKQVIIQQLREAEKEAIFQEFKKREGEIVSAVVERYEPKGLLVTIGKAEAIFPHEHLLPREHYRRGERIRGYLLEARRTSKEPAVILSRTHPDFIKVLFNEEIPEISERIIEIKSIARYPGECTKIAVSSKKERVEPLGTCIGVKGSRIKMILKELGGERVDVIRWNGDPALFIANALAPAKCEEVRVNPAKKEALVILPDDQLSLAIGKKGQNVKLAAKLSGYKINVKSRSAIREELLPAIVVLPGIGKKTAASLAKIGLSSIKELAEASISTLSKISGIGKKRAEKIITAAKETMGHK